MEQVDSLSEPLVCFWFLGKKLSQVRLHSRPYLLHIFEEQEPLWTLAKCNLASIGKLYQHLRHVYPSFTRSNGEPIVLKRNWLESVASKNPQMHAGSQVISIATVTIYEKPTGNKTVQSTCMHIKSEVTYLILALMLFTL